MVYCKKMTVILWITCMIIVYMLVHLLVIYIHAKYKLFEDEETVWILHICFWILWFFLIWFFILFLATL